MAAAEAVQRQQEQLLLLPPHCALREWLGRAPTCVGRVQAALHTIAAQNEDVNACIEVLGEAALLRCTQTGLRCAIIPSM
jgi:hypothetical protein